jgi:hypothetical protein
LHVFIRSRLKRFTRIVAPAFGFAMFCMILSGAASAQGVKRTSVTFSGPVEIPGVGAQVLPAGTYVFRLFDSLVDRHIVQILNADESHIYSTILAVPNYRLQATDQTVITFAERPAGQPVALRAWFYPGDNSGQEFVYPRQRAVEIARETNQPVIFIPDEVAENIVAPIVTRTDPPAVALRQAPLRVVTPQGQDIEIAEVVVSPPVQTAALPKTAGVLPLLALMGLLSMAAGLALKKSCAR